MSKSAIVKLLVVFIVFLGIAIVVPTLASQRSSNENSNDEMDLSLASISVQAPNEEAETVQDDDAVVAGAVTELDPGGEPDEIPEPVVTEAPFEPYAVEETEPGKMLASSDIMYDGQIVESYLSPDRINFGRGDVYSRVDGITTFRGNNFRDSASYGNADIVEAKFGDKWSRNTGSLAAPDGAVWTGHGWSGQPLIVKWPKQTREIMNMHPWAKEQDELVEVIYPSMDGYIYFLELVTGEPTRNKLYIGYTFKGAGAVDPRGYPLLYVGAGYTSTLGYARIFVISLVDGSVLHTFGLGDRFAPRNWTAADASPLIDADNDKLIYPSENGVLYIIDLNSEFDLSAGTVKVTPSDPVKWRFAGKRSNSGGRYWLGIEASPAIWQGHIFLADNGGHLVCLNLNTLQPAWVQDVLDDTNNTPVIEIEDGRPYVYISTGFHGGWRAPANLTAEVPIWKFDAVTGEVVWRTDYICYTQSGVSGGVQGTIAMGKNALEDLIFVPIARTPTRGVGILAALDKSTGEVVWEYKTNQYSWSSPVCVYDVDGNGYIIHTTSGGYMYMLDGLTGELLDTVLLGGVIEASPAVYQNTVVIGTRASKIWGVQLT